MSLRDECKLPPPRQFFNGEVGYLECELVVCLEKVAEHLSNSNSVYRELNKIIDEKDNEIKRMNAKLWKLRIEKLELKAALEYYVYRDTYHNTQEHWVKKTKFEHAAKIAKEAFRSKFYDILKPNSMELI